MPAYAVPKFPAGGSITGHAAAALTVGRFVKQTTTAPNGGCPVVDVATAAARVGYVTAEAAASGAKVLLHQPGQKVWVEAGETITAGQMVEAGTAGVAMVRNAGIVCGECVQGSTVGLPVLIDFRPAFL